MHFIYSNDRVVLLLSMLLWITDTAQHLWHRQVHFETGADKETLNGYLVFIE